MEYKKHITIQIFDNATIVPGKSKWGIKEGMYDSKGKYVFGSGKRKLGQPHTDSYNEIDIDSCNVVEADCTVINIGYLMKHFGHMIVDGSVCLWGVFEIDKKFPIVFIQEAEILPEHYKELFELIGISDSRLIEIERPTKFKKVYFPELSYDGGNYVSPLFAFPFCRARSNASLLGEKEKDGSKKIYLSRAQFTKNNKLDNYGEELIEYIFKENGYQIIYPEQLSVLQKIRELSNCETLVSGNGTSAHNVVWCGSKLKKLIILEKFSGDNPHQMALDMIHHYETEIIPIYNKKSEQHIYFVTCTKKFKDFCKNNNYNMTVSGWIQIHHFIQYLTFVIRKIQVKFKFRSRLILFFRRIESILDKV